MPKGPFFTPEPIDEAEWLITAQQFLAGMPHPLGAYVLFRYERLSAEEIEEQLGVPEPELRQRLFEFMTGSDAPITGRYFGDDWAHYVGCERVCPDQQRKPDKDQ